MKISRLFFLCCLFLALPLRAEAALPSYMETVAPRGTDALITAVWHGEAGPSAVLLPVPPKGTLETVGVVNATAGQYAVGKVNGEAVLSIPLEVVTGPVRITVVWKATGLYAPPKKAGGDEGPSGRGDITGVKYAISNTTGLGFAKATLNLSLPQGMRLFQVISKGAKFMEKDGTYTVTRSLTGKGDAPGMAAGARLDLDLEMLPPKGGSAVLWACVLLLAAAFLYYNRDAIPGRAPKDAEAS